MNAQLKNSKIEQGENNDNFWQKSFRIKEISLILDFQGLF